MKAFLIQFCFKQSHNLPNRVRTSEDARGIVVKIIKLHDLRDSCSMYIAGKHTWYSLTQCIYEYYI